MRSDTLIVFSLTVEEAENLRRELDQIESTDDQPVIDQLYDAISEQLDK